VIRPFASQPHQLTANRQRHRRRPPASGGVFQRLQRRIVLESGFPLPHRPVRPSDRSSDLLGPSPFMRVQHDPGTLNDQMNVATTPHELLQLAEQVTLDTERTRARTARHTLSIDFAFGLFPETRIELRASSTSRRYLPKRATNPLLAGRTIRVPRPKRVLRLRSLRKQDACCPPSRWAAPSSPKRMPLRRLPPPSTELRRPAARVEISIIGHRSHSGWPACPVGESAASRSVNRYGRARRETPSVSDSK
jgi:hypothetical protein